MLELRIPGAEFFNEQTQEFVESPEVTLQLEHSLLSLSKWEAKHKKRFLDNTVEKTDEETRDYVRCMALNVIPEESYMALFMNSQLMNQIVEYIEDPHTATVIKHEGGANHGEAITSELIYYWMVSAQIPFECQTWHLNRLITLIGIVGEKNKPTKKMSQAEIAKQNHALHEARKAKRMKK